MFKSKSTLCLLLPAFLAACTPGPTKQVPPEVQEGQKQFHRVCSNCHGSDAMGGQTKAPKLIDAEFLPPDFTDDDIRDTIINGSSSGKMPPQRASFSDEQITEIIKYLRYSQKTAGLAPAEEDEFQEAVMAGDDAGMPEDPPVEEDIEEPEESEDDPGAKT